VNGDTNGDKESTVPDVQVNGTSMEGMVTEETARDAVRAALKAAGETENVKTMGDVVE
jgi:hypothetical protein